MTQITSKAEQCTPVQPCRDGTKHDSCKPPPRKVLDVQDTGKPSQLVAIWLHIDSQVGKDLVIKNHSSLSREQYTWFGSEVEESTCRFINRCIDLRNAEE